MSRTKENKAKPDRRSWLTEKCSDCMALLLNSGVSLGSTIKVCFDSASDKMFSKETKEIVN